MFWFEDFLMFIEMIVMFGVNVVIFYFVDLCVYSSLVIWFDNVIEL